MTKRFAIHVRGKARLWSFVFDADPQYLDEWRADGLDVDRVVNEIPAWVVRFGLVRPWCFVEDLVRR